ncbi:TadE/TadG family type IV pilus assembly protein [Vitreimonas flagellata]|uniref:TadE/TadG family type IV pilus assembly protein n=1 Tax=Vitreimonas flagellata TaxID=2560861 RepID=UPI0010752ED7|nr:TadE/TadG family type IV pilus assembly protein [Vitreimonas flagellata]
MFAPFKAARRALRRFARTEDGAVALEFGFVAVPFFMLTFGLAEVSLMGLAQTNLDYATSEAGREIRTGRAQMGGVTEEEIKEAVCLNFGRFMAVDCEAKLFVDVRTYEAFTDINVDPPVVDGELQTDGFAYEPGEPSDIVVVRTYYRWHVLTPMFDRILANTNGGERLVVSTMMFRNEPYESAPNS